MLVKLSGGQKSIASSVAWQRPIRRGNDSPRKCRQRPIAKACGASLFRGSPIDRENWAKPDGKVCRFHQHLLGFDATKITGHPCFEPSGQRTGPTRPIQSTQRAKSQKAAGNVILRGLGKMRSSRFSPKGFQWAGVCKNFQKSLQYLQNRRWLFAEKSPVQITFENHTEKPESMRLSYSNPSS